MFCYNTFAPPPPFAQEEAAETPLTLIALGGYGRGELNPFSDVDVMLLHRRKRKISPHLEEMVEQVLHLLWDSGFKVGHSTRSIKEAITQANHDMLTKTAMLESRFLAGDAELAKEFREQFRSKCVEGHEREYIEMRMRSGRTSQEIRRQRLPAGAAREARMWRTPRLPKSSMDDVFQREVWLSTNQLVGKDWLSETDQRRIERAHDFSCAYALICTTRPDARPIFCTSTSRNRSRNG
jgi:[protein-PII] uridylyltransferase